MSYQQNPSFMPATWPLSQSYPPYCGSGMASFETSTMPCMNIYEGSGRVGAEANVGQVMVPVPVYLYQHIPPVYGGYNFFGTPAQSRPPSFDMVINQQQLQAYDSGLWYVQPQPQPSGTKRRPRAIPIIDPRTGQEINLGANQSLPEAVNSLPPLPSIYFDRHEEMPQLSPIASSEQPRSGERMALDNIGFRRDEGQDSGFED